MNRENGDDAEPGRQVEAPLERARQRPAEHEQTEPEPADEKREPEEVEPPHDVLGPRRPRRAVSGGRRWRGDPDAVRVDARDDVAVAGEGMPADGVRAAR